MYFSHGSNHSKGVMVLFKNNLECNVKEYISDDNGRFIVIDVTINDCKFLLCNMYAPNSNAPTEQKLFFTNINEMINKMNEDADKMIISGGDMNILMNPALDRDGGNARYNKDVMSQVDSWLESCDLIDIWRVRNPNVRQYTWRQPTPLIQSRLDYWFVSDVMQDIISAVEISPAINSDHSAICMKISSNFNDMKGPSYWKFNNSLCDDKQYCDELATKIKDWLIKYDNVTDARLVWELLKFEIRGFTQTYSKKKARERRDKIRLLENELKSAEHTLCVNPSDDNRKNWDRAKSNLDDEYSYITQGIIVRSRAEWVEKGEKNSKYFLNLEKANKTKSTIRKVIDHNEVQHSDPSEVLNIIKGFYSNLYAKKKVDLNCDTSSNFLNSVKIPKLLDCQMKSCEGLLSVNECFKVFGR